MLDTTICNSGFGLALLQNYSAYGDFDLKKFCTDMDVTEDQVAKWIDGAEIDTEDRTKIALFLNVPAWMLREDYDEALNLWTGGKIPSNGMYTPSDSIFEGYWGNIGFKVPGRDKSIWMSCSDTQAEVFCREIMAAESKTVCFKGMGLFGYIAVPDNLKAIRGIPEAGDHIIGDWEIDPCDPVEGLPVGFASIFSNDSSYIYEPEMIPAGCEKDFETYCDEAGGFEKVERALSQLTVFYKDGTSEMFEIDSRDDLMGDTVGELFYSFHKTDEERVSHLKFHSNECPVVIPLQAVSLVRFPVTFLDPYFLTFNTED
ncbi:hypothetical protein [Pseudosulfitobacter pseudonitzschiae]|uniref:hypothetical protein n=1 Tax=Pseudosulfitobacter pseudonitzschiae TaxID=1402135 RepID=UPI003B7B9A38